MLTGNPQAATKVIESVVDAQPDLGKLDNAHIDRLTVLRSREIESAVIAQDGLPIDVAKALAALPVQQREAWVFARVYRLTSREMARAMDCSHTAAERHLVQAEAAMTGAVAEDADSIAQTLLTYVLALDVPAFYRAKQDRRRQLRRVIQMIILTAVLASIIVIAQILG